MARLRLLLTAVLAVAALAVAVVAVPAGATTPTANKAKFCSDIKGISSKLSNTDTSDLSSSKAAFKQFASKLKDAAKNSPGSVKTATNQLAGIYSALGSGDYSALAKLQGTSFTKSLTKFSTYIATNCG
jgi:hypothetical protein